MATVCARVWFSRLRLVVLLIGICGVLTSVWQELDARQIEAATPKQAPGWFNGFDVSAPFALQPTTSARATSTNDGPPATVMIAPTGNFVSGPIVCVLDREGRPLTPRLAYPPFGGGIRLAVGDTNGDGVPEYVTVPASSAPTIPVRLFTRPGVHTFVGEGFVFPTPFSGGLNVAMGDVSGDRLADIIVAPGAGGPPLVRVFTLTGGPRLYSEFFAFAPSFTGGVHVAAADINGDGIAEVIAGAATGTPEVRIYRTVADRAVEIARGIGIDPRANGVSVASGDVNGDGISDLVLGAGSGVAPQVRVFSIAGGVRVIGDFFAYETAFQGGVRVAVGDVNGDGRAEVLTAPGPGRQTHPGAWAFSLDGVDFPPNAPRQIYSAGPAFGTAYLGGMVITSTKPF